MGTTTETPTVENKKQEELSKESKDKVRAGDDVIKYAETHEVEKKKPKAPAKPAEKKQTNMIEGFDRFSGKTVTIPLDSITALSRYIYVHNIFDPTPTVEAISFKAIAPGSRIVMMDIDEATFEDLRQLPKFKGRVHYNYVDNMAKNNPKKNLFYHRTFHANYPEWIKPEDVAAQAKATVSHYGIPDLSGIEKVLWPDFDGQIQKTSLSENPTDMSEEITDEVESQDTEE